MTLSFVFEKSDFNYTEVVNDNLSLAQLADAGNLTVSFFLHFSIRENSISRIVKH